MVVEIKKLLGSEKLVIGTDEVLKNLRNGKVQKVFLSSNCNTSTKDDVKHFADFSDAEVIELEIPNDELGTICKKPFSVSILALLK